MGCVVMRRRQVSRRSLALTFVGLHALAMASQRAPGAVDPDRAILYEAIPLSTRIGLWTVCGVLTIVFAWNRRTEGVAVVAAVIMPVERALSHLWSWVAWALPSPPGGSPDGWAFALEWAALAGVILTVSAWLELDLAGGEVDAGR